MATVGLEQVNKVYENGFHAVSDLDLEVADGEFMVLVGPSGCGKTTALRMVAGLESISSGTLRIGGRPDNLFVAAFIGSPAMNLYEAAVGEGGRSVRLGSQLIQLPEPVVVAHSALAAYAGRSVVLGLRPEHLPVAGSGLAGPTLAADVDLVEALGAELVVHFTIDARRVRPEGAVDADAEAVTEAGEGVARVDPDARVKPGERITFAVNATGMQFFDPGTGQAIWAA